MMMMMMMMMMMITGCLNNLRIVGICAFCFMCLFCTDLDALICYVNWLQARDIPAVGDVWNMLVAGVSQQNSFSRRDIQQADDDVMHKLADIFNLPRRQLANSLSIVKHTEL